MPPAAASVDESTNACSLYRFGRMPSTSTRCSFSRIACHTRPGDDFDRPADDEEDDREEREREPVQVLRVEDADERVRQLRVVGAKALLAVCPVVGILQREHRAGLRERERHHRERDPAHSHAHGPEDVREHDRDAHREEDRDPEAPVPVRDRDVGQVDADRDVERVAEREQTGVPELEVVGEREPAEQDACGEQLQRPRARDRAGRTASGSRRGAPAPPRALRIWRAARARRARACDGSCARPHDRSREPARPREQDDPEQQDDDHVADAGGGVVVRVLLRRAPRARRQRRSRRSSRDRR